MNKHVNVTDAFKSRETAKIVVFAAARVAVKYVGTNVTQINKVVSTQNAI